MHTNRRGRDYSRSLFAARISLVATACLVLALVVPGLAWAQTPAATASPTSGPVGTDVHVIGTGFIPSELVSISFSGDSANLVQGLLTSTTGGVDAHISVPCDATLGGHTIVITGNTGETAQTPFTVTSGSAGTCAPPPLQYFALGDSYSSGEGDPTFDTATNQSSPVADFCHRSTNWAYPIVFAGLSGADLGPRPSSGMSPSHFVACSGATMNNIGGVQQWPGEPVGGQQNVAGLSTAQWITITIGGNDANFGTIIGNCYRSATPCNTQYDQSGDETTLISSLLGFLYNTYLRIKGVAPNAQIRVLTYPQVLAPDSDPATPGFQGTHCLGGTDILNGLDDAEQGWIRDRTSQLNGVIKQAATAAGVKVIDLENAFAGHYMCSIRPWVVSPLSGALTGNADKYTFHPKRAGHAAIARRVYKNCIAAGLC